MVIHSHQMASLSTVRVDNSKPPQFTWKMDQGIDLANISGLVSLIFFIIT